MKILHTADWHLGKKLDRFSRIEEQRAVMGEIVQIANAQKVDVVIIAGDLFDNFTPNTDAIELFYKTVKQLSLGGRRPVVAISGNHDAPKLIDAPDPLARECGIFLIGQPFALVTPIETQDFKITLSSAGFIELQLASFPYPLRIIHTAYANEPRLREELEGDKQLAINQFLSDKWQALAQEYCDSKGVNILTAHLFMNPKNGELLEEPEGERPIRIGNADMIYTNAIPPQMQYTALGHLHGFKNIGSEEKPIVYASSPLCYSFSEAGEEKYVAIIEAEPNKAVHLSKIPLTQGKPLVRKQFASIEAATSWLKENPNTWVELTLELKEYLRAEDRKRLYNTHEGIVFLIPKLLLDTEHNPSAELSLQDINFENITPLFESYFKYKNGGIAPNQEILNLFNEAINTPID
ncbi:Exodeoxyribonuclease I subunit D [Capnocytophaga granulosa]|uniref:Nuclease SbcCD subunit D n=1 Tax=Capnocytophaga granulosa TaxID=45242 RepID=A0A1H2QCL2_9FLAO|nr:exonuclease subunit SbcD [Capnocytophaga granulosa]EPD29700.1 exonuclease SbcCD, D subunit [Capnocytophaga granulosa ATCC 51502]SDW04896.1 Exodeoxyribonuclease I subunit D [Capnocytophaga granulosa]SUX22353.1 Nuclease sbcCD subunit D [Capnocytophaga granulosa]